MALFLNHDLKKVQSFKFFHFQKLERFFRFYGFYVKKQAKSSKNGCNRHPERPTETLVFRRFKRTLPFRTTKGACEGV